MNFSDVVADPCNSCVKDNCVYYCGVVADLCDSCVEDLCVLLWSSG